MRLLAGNPDLCRNTPLPDRQYLLNSNSDFILSLCPRSRIRFLLAFFFVERIQSSTFPMITCSAHWPSIPQKNAIESSLFMLRSFPFFYLVMFSSYTNKRDFFPVHPSCRCRKMEAGESRHGRPRKQNSFSVHA